MRGPSSPVVFLMAPFSKRVAISDSRAQLWSGSFGTGVTLWIGPWGGLVENSIW